VWGQAVTEFKADNNSSALELYLDALSIAEKLLGEDHEVCAELHISLGHTYMAMCTFHEAEEMYLRSISMIEEKLNQYHSSPSNNQERQLADHTRDDDKDVYCEYCTGSASDSTNTVPVCSCRRSSRSSCPGNPVADAASLKSSEEMLLQLTRALEGISRYCRLLILSVSLSDCRLLILSVSLSDCRLLILSVSLSVCTLVEE
jgi:tetratricopeptide (TPR) repeat protein